MPPPATTLSLEEDFDQLWTDLAGAAAQWRSPAESAPAAKACPPYLNFGQGGNALEHCIFGWSAAEPQWTWTLGPEATLDLPVPVTEESFFLNVRVSPMQATVQSVQRVRVLVDGEPLAEWRVSHAGHYFALLHPDRFLGRSRFLLQFQLPDAISPQALGWSGDDRDLALRFFELWLSPLTPLAFGA